jgi:hypothetical protein
VEKNKRCDSDEGTRRTEGYAQAIRLLNEKREIQASLREVDRKLRGLESQATGVTRLAREDLDRSAKGLHTY